MKSHSQLIWRLGEFRQLKTEVYKNIHQCQRFISSHNSLVSIKLGRGTFPISGSMTSLYRKTPLLKMTCFKRNVKSGLAQNGCSDTNIIRRMMELPLKLMTLLTVTISKSSTACFGPLMGLVRTSVALTLLVCCRTEETETGGM